jgi:hypothetical protein
VVIQVLAHLPLVLFGLLAKQGVFLDGNGQQSCNHGIEQVNGQNGREYHRPLRVMNPGLQRTVHQLDSCKFCKRTKAEHQTGNGKW